MAVHGNVKDPMEGWLCISTSVEMASHQKALLMGNVVNPNVLEHA